MPFVAHPIPSLPAWGEWIEIGRLSAHIFEDGGLSPHGESGLKFHKLIAKLYRDKVSPRMGRVD